jgi:hypothetical protein
MAVKPDFEQDEKPLDPAAERVRQRLVRFLAINLGILFLAVMIVLGAVVYRAFLTKPAPDVAVATPGGQTQTAGELSVPSGAEIVSQSISGNRLSLHVRQNGSDAILIFDLGSGEQVGRFEIRRAVP